MEIQKTADDHACQVKACAQSAVAIADGKTFFSKRSKDIRLCEAHLFEAEDMAVKQGMTLSWKELEAAPPEGALVKAPPQEEQLKQELSQEATNAEQTLAAVQDFEINSKEDMQFAAEALTETKDSMKKLEEKRKEITGPLNTALRAINELFKPAAEYYGKVERTLKSKIAQAQSKASEVAREALAAAGVAAGQGDQTALNEALAVHEEALEFPEAKGIQYRTTWKFEIVDASLIPREYMTPDLRLIQGAVTHTKENTEIPGIRVYQEKLIASVS